MNPAYRSKSLAAAVVASLVVLALPAWETTAEAQQPIDPMAPVAANGQSQLRWTPHRAATLPRPEPARQPSTVATSPAPARNSVTPPAAGGPSTAEVLARTPGSVSLAEGVPPIGGQSPAGGPAYAPLRGRLPLTAGDWSSANRIAGGFQTMFNPDDPSGLFGNRMLRSPQGEAGRPILAQEGVQRRQLPQPAIGGDAPRFNPSMPSYGANPNRLRASTPGRERIAMNVDSIPSVMTRGPQSAAIAGTPAAPASQVMESLPAPTIPSPTIQPSQSTVPQMPRPSIIDSADPSLMPGRGPLDMQGPTPDGYDPYQAGSADSTMILQGPDGLLMGQYPTELHVESFYDDPYACEEELGILPFCACDGRICAWLRRFGRPYYGWRWYRDFTASAGVTSFQNTTDLGLHGNYGVNEYANWAMPFWNAFGVGWQVGVRGVQANFQGAAITDPAGATIFSREARNQVFVTTGFFTRAFEGRGLQGGAVYDYLHDSWYDTVDVAQVRGELSYVWGYHEFGFWGAANVADTNGIFSKGSKGGNFASTLDLYTGFYRLHFGDANELKLWGGASGSGDGLCGALMRAPMGRSLALEGTFTYLWPGSSNTVTLPTKDVITYSEQAWNMSVNLVFYPAGRSRRSLASPYRPLFDVADNGSMIRSIAIPKP